MGKEIYLDPIEFQDQLSSFGEGSEEISGVNISEIKNAKKETKLDSIDKLDGLIDELSNAMKKYAQMISTDKDAMDKIAATIQKNDQENADKISNKHWGEKIWHV